MAEIKTRKIETLSDHCFLTYNKTSKVWNLYDKTKTGIDVSQFLFQDVNSSKPQGSLNSYRNKKLNDTFEIVNIELSLLRVPQKVRVGKQTLNSEVFAPGDTLTEPVGSGLKMLDEELYTALEDFVSRFITLSLLVGNIDLYNSDMKAIKTMNKTNILWETSQTIAFKISVDNFLNAYQLDDCKTYEGAIPGDGTNVEGVITKSFEPDSGDIIYFPIMLKLFGYNNVSIGTTK